MAEDYIVNSNDAELIYSFALKVKGANRQRLEEAICKTNNIVLMCEFAEQIEDANFEKIYLAASKVDSNNIIYDVYKQRLQSLYSNYCKTDDEKYNLLLTLLAAGKFTEIKENKNIFAKLFENECITRTLEK